MRKEQLQGYKKIKINHAKFVIRKINPILDFEVNNIPQIFTSFQTRRKVKETIPDLKALIEQMKIIVEAGVVKPQLVKRGYGDKRGHEDGITVDDLFRNEEMGSRLFSEIMFHTLNRFKGLKSLFFSLKIKLLYFINLLKNTESYHQRFPSRIEN